VAAEVYDAEVEGARHGLQAVLNLLAAQDTAAATRVHVCLDNTAVIAGLLGAPAASSQEAFLDFQRLRAQHGNVAIRWVPGHQGIQGNEEADALAKEGAALEAPQPQPQDSGGPASQGRRATLRPRPARASDNEAAEGEVTAARLRRVARARTADAFKEWWDKEAPTRYKELGVQLASGCPPELELPRPILHCLLAARSGHGDFADYHERFAHEDAALECSCGRRKAPEHFLICDKVRPQDRPRLTGDHKARARILLAGVPGKFAGFVQKTGFFTRICPRGSNQ
jgi:hypothetical protein